MNYFKDETAIIDSGAVIGEGSKIWHFSHISGGAEIGKNVIIGQNVFVGNKAVIGDNCKIQNNVSIYDNVILEEGVFCGPSVVFTNVTNPRSFVERKKEYKQTHVKKGASLGANSTILCGNTINEYAFVGANALITKDVKSFALMVGSPAKQSGWMTIEGEKLHLPLEGSEAFKCENGNLYRLDGEYIYLNNE